MRCSRSQCPCSFKLWTKRRVRRKPHQRNTLRKESVLLYKSFQSANTEKALTNLSIPFSERFKLLDDYAHQFRYISTVQKLIKETSLSIFRYRLCAVHRRTWAETWSNHRTSDVHFFANTRRSFKKGPAGQAKRKMPFLLWNGRKIGVQHILHWHT